MCFLVLVAMPAKAGDFWQQQWTVPGQAESNNLIIRPIRESDKARFFHSYMTSQQWLYKKLGWAWPSEKSTLEQNSTMVDYHLEQAEQKTAFTYVVLDKSDNSIIGAVYMVPVASERQENSGISKSAYNAEVSWWLLESAVDNNLHNDLFALLTRWLGESWPWRQVMFPVSENNATALQLLESSKARYIGRNLDTREKYFSYAISRK
ncbi:MAG: GNAT family N-acetyltransferase [Idiomarina piscisalsi]|uniref:GNAT family N-acetyltransferase n=2 Tax=Idiomarina piscisalsi TaxID=1096243 RepID=A0ABM6LWJ0_9GAMM|nr:GNAT family N-acetyltransferase [Idiomarina piscisalsi]MTJ02109.1 GNAT family N-acetyltransferase [Idiomarina piscisalsi]